MHPFATCLLAAILLSPLALAAPADLGRAGDATFSLDPEQGLGGVTLTINGVTCRPFAGAAAVGPDGKPDPSIPLHVTPAVGDQVLRLTVTSSDPRVRGLDPGQVEGLGEWRRLDLSGQALAYGLSLIHI